MAPEYRGLSFPFYRIKWVVLSPLAAIAVCLLPCGTAGTDLRGDAMKAAAMHRTRSASSQRVQANPARRARRLHRCFPTPSAPPQRGLASARGRTHRNDTPTPKASCCSNRNGHNRTRKGVRLVADAAQRLSNENAMRLPLSSECRPHRSRFYAAHARSDRRERCRKPLRQPGMLELPSSMHAAIAAAP